MAGGQARTAWASSDVIVDNAASSHEARTAWASSDVVVANDPVQNRHEARTAWASSDVIIANDPVQNLHEARVAWASSDIIIANTRTHVFAATVARAVSSSSADLGVHEIAPDPLRIPAQHVVKSLSARIVSRGGLFR